MLRNILLLHCHDLGRFLGLYGVDTVTTAHLDALAAESTVFEAAFSTAPHCSPARASLFTGTYPQQNGVLGLTHKPFGWDLNDPSTHLAHRLSAFGYRTELVGVHHESKVLPDAEVAARLGFDRVRTGGDRDTVAARAIDALEAAAGAGTPFYLQVGFHEPHRSPSERDPFGVMGFLGDHVDADTSRGITVPPFLRDDEGARAEMAELQGAVRAMDEGVGRVLARLEALGLRDETIVVFTTDHGLALPRAKCTLYDAGTGVALVVRVPGRAGWAGRRVEDLVSHVDVAPTLFDLLDLPVPEAIAGDSLVPVVEHGARGRAHAFGQLTYHTYYDPKRSVRSRSHKLVVNFANAPQPMDPSQSWIRRSAPRDVTGSGVRINVTAELYDLAADPDELTNIVDVPEYEPIQRSLAQALSEWMLRVRDPLLEPGPRAPQHEAALSFLASSGTDEACPTHRAHDPRMATTRSE